MTLSVARTAEAMLHGTHVQAVDSKALIKKIMEEWSYQILGTKLFKEKRMSHG